MRLTTVWILAGLASIVGGAIDILGPAVYPHLSEPARNGVYVLIDLLLLFGLLGLQSATWRRTGWLGLVGFVVAVAAVLLVRTNSAHIFGAASSTISAAAWSIGMVVMGAALLISRGSFQMASLLWIAALVVGLGGLLLKAGDLPHRVATWCFALGFVATGVTLVREARTAA